MSKEIDSQAICRDILDLFRQLKTSMLQVAEDHDITPIQLSALYCVCNCGQLPMGKIADVLHCDPSNVTGLVDRLVNQGLLTREECPTDRRAKTLQVTAKGQILIDEVYRQLPAKFGLDRLTSDELHTLHGLLKKLTAD